MLNEEIPLLLSYEKIKHIHITIPRLKIASDAKCIFMRKAHVCDWVNVAG